MANKKSVYTDVIENKVHKPKWVAKANQWVITEMKNGKQLQTWFSKEDKEKAISKYNELVA